MEISQSASERADGGMKRRRKTDLAAAAAAAEAGSAVVTADVRWLVRKERVIPSLKTQRNWCVAALQIRLRHRSTSASATGCDVTLTTLWLPWHSLTTDVETCNLLCIITSYRLISIYWQLVRFLQKNAGMLRCRLFNAGDFKACRPC